MALIIKDRVKENSVTSSTGTLTLTGAPQSFQTFSSAIGNGNTTYYAITEQGTGNFEVGLGTVGAGTLSRDTVLESSNGGSLVNFGSATKDVFCTYPAEKAILGNTNAIASTGTGSVVLSASPTLTGTVSLPLSSFGATSTTIGNTATNVTIGQPNTDVNNTITIGNITATPNGGSFSTINIGASAYSDIDTSGGPTITNILGDCNFDPSAFITFGNGTFSSGLTVNGTLNASGALILGGATTPNQSIASAQTSGNLTIGGLTNQSGTISLGGTAGTGVITIGRSTAAQTINIGVSVVPTLITKTINIGTGANSATSTSNITVGGTAGFGTLTFGQSVNAQTVNIATGANTGVKTVNIGTNASSAATNITINATTKTSTTTVQGYFKPPALASAPTYVKGAVYFDTTLNKLRVGGATTWETITSI